MLTAFLGDCFLEVTGAKGSFFRLFTYRYVIEVKDVKMGQLNPFSGSWVAHGWLMVGSWVAFKGCWGAGALCSMGNFFGRDYRGDLSKLVEPVIDDAGCGPFARHRVHGLSQSPPHR